MTFIINRKKMAEQAKGTPKTEKNFEYKALTNFGKEKAEFNFTLNTVSNESKSEEENVLERIQKLENQISNLKGSEVYKILEKSHALLVKPPLKKTNVLLKNVNFQYAVKLWDYLIDNVENEKETDVNDKEDYMDDGSLKVFTDELFLLNYLSLAATKEQDEEKKRAKKQELREKLTANLVEKLIDINEQLSEEQLKDLVSKQYTVIKYRRQVSSKGIEDVFKKQIEKYIKKITDIKV